MTTIIVGFLALIFIFFGFYTPQRFRGGVSGSFVATVDGESISLKEFNQAYEQRVQFFESMFQQSSPDKKAKFDRKLLEGFGLRRTVLNDLIQQKLLSSEAKKLNFKISDQELATRIRELPYFQKDKRFDHALYVKLLDANGLRPGKFEDQIRQGLVIERLQKILSNAVVASEQEIEQAYREEEEKRQFQYVAFSSGKDTKENKTQAEAFLKQWNSKDASKLAKSFKVELKETTGFSRTAQYIEGIGNLPEVVRAAFSQSEGFQVPKIYESSPRVFVVWNLKQTHPDMAKFSEKRNEVESRLLTKKHEEFLARWLELKRMKTKIRINEDLLKSMES